MARRTQEAQAHDPNAPKPAPRRLLTIHETSAYRAATHRLTAVHPSAKPVLRGIHDALLRDWTTSVLVDRDLPFRSITTLGYRSSHGAILPPLQVLFIFFPDELTIRLLSVVELDPPFDP